MYTKPTFLLILTLNVFSSCASIDSTPYPYPTGTYPSTAITTKLPCYNRLTCFENSILNLSTCQCECKPGYYLESFRCVPFSTIPPTTTKPSCNLDCRAGSLVFLSGTCTCICYEFYVFNGNSCYLASYYPRVNSCDECSNFQSPFNRPMRCVQNVYDKFCVP